MKKNPQNHPVSGLSIAILILSSLDGPALSQSNNVVEDFKRIPDNGAERFSITRSDGISIPPADSAGRFHQQGIQKLPGGEFVVSGSSKEGGYIYLTDQEKRIIKVISPKHGIYNHLGGFQIEDNILAVGYEKLESGPSGTSVIMFFDIQDLHNPIILSHLLIERQISGSTAGAVGICKNADRWLVVAANWNSERLDFYESDSGDIRSPSSKFHHLSNWSSRRDGLSNGSIDRNWTEYQSINLFRQTDGKLFLVAMHTNVLGMQDWADLYQVDKGSFIQIEKLSKKHFHRNGEGPRFLYGSGVFWDQERQSYHVISCEGSLSANGLVNRCNIWK